MNCYMCDNAVSEVEAVAVCQHCGVASLPRPLGPRSSRRQADGTSSAGVRSRSYRAAQRRQDAREFAGSFIFDDEADGGFGSVP